MNLLDVQKNSIIDDDCVIDFKHNGPMVMATYNRNCFNSSRWTEYTINSRGNVYDVETGKPLNNPIPKLFNVGEIEDVTIETIERDINTSEHVEVFDKVNGHCVILFNAYGEWHVITKGSWQMDFLPRDREILSKAIQNLESTDEFNSITFIFEIVGEHDKHTLYDKQVERYGDGGVAVLLAARHSNGHDYDRAHLAGFGHILEVPIAHNKDVELMGHGINGFHDRMKGHTDIEGYIIRVRNTDSEGRHIARRYKVKTTEYWNLRYNNQMGSGRQMIKLFKVHFLNVNAALRNLPEEFYDTYRDLVKEYNYFVYLYENYLEGCISHISWDIKTTDDFIRIVGKENIGKECTKGYQKSHSEMLFFLRHKTLRHSNKLKQIFIDMKKRNLE